MYSSLIRPQQGAEYPVKTSLRTKIVLSVVTLLSITEVKIFAQKVTSEVDKAAPFAEYRTFAFKPGLLMIGGNEEQLNPVLMDSLRHELNARGLTEVQDKPSVYVTYFGTLGGVTSSGSLVAPGQALRYDWGIPQGWSAVSSSTVVEGSLLIEMADASTNKLVWIATSKGVLKNLGKPEKQKEKIPEVVSKAFLKYPIKAQPAR